MAINQIYYVHLLFFFTKIRICIRFQSHRKTNSYKMPKDLKNVSEKEQFILFNNTFATKSNTKKSWKI